MRIPGRNAVPSKNELKVRKVGYPAAVAAAAQGLVAPAPAPAPALARTLPVAASVSSGNYVPPHWRDSWGLDADVREVPELRIWEEQTLSQIPNTPIKRQLRKERRQKWMETLGPTIETKEPGVVETLENDSEIGDAEGTWSGRKFLGQGGFGCCALFTKENRKRKIVDVSSI